MPFKRNLVFLAAESESVTNTHKRLKILYGVNADDKCCADRWAWRIAGPETGQAELSRASPWPVKNSGHSGHAATC
jgi:hypothetical protein